MSKVKFSSKQQEILRNNKYTVRVIANILSLSKEFKEIFYREYLSGDIPSNILRKYGYPVELLGEDRIWGISYCIKKEYEKTVPSVISVLVHLGKLHHRSLPKTVLGSFRRRLTT